MNATLLADPSTSGLVGWLQSNAVSVILLVIALSILFAAQRGHASKVVMTGGLALVGLLFLGIAVTPGAYTHISDWMVHMVGVG